MGSLDLSRYGLGGPVDDLARLCAQGDGNACRAMVAMQRDAELVRLARQSAAPSAGPIGPFAPIPSVVGRISIDDALVASGELPLRPSTPVDWSRPTVPQQPQAPRAAIPGFLDTLFSTFTGGGTPAASAPRPQGAAPRVSAPSRAVVSKPSGGGSGDSAADVVGALTPITTSVTDALMRIEAGRAARRRSALAPAPVAAGWSTGAKVAAGVGGVVALGLLGKLMFGGRSS